MDKRVSILTARIIGEEKWQENSKNIFELFPFSENKNIPVFVRRFVLKLYKFFNKFDFIIGARLFLNRKNFNVIISNSINQAIMYSFLSMIFGKKNKIHILNEIYFQAPISLRRKLRPAVFKIFVKNVDYMRTSSNKEIDNYSTLLNIDKNRFWFLPFPTTISHPEIINTDENFILSAGKQFRDYATLIKATKDLDIKLVIISDNNSIKDIEVSEEVEVYKNIPKSHYLDFLSRSKLVVVPLANDFTSCGQITVLEAMSYGKPVITTKVAGTMDYIVDGKTGVFYKIGDVDDLKNKIIYLLDNEDVRAVIIEQALQTVKLNFTHQFFVSQYLKFIDEKFQKLNR